MKSMLLAALLGCRTLLPDAPGFWLESDRFFYDEGETAIVRFRSGAGFDGANWTGDDADVQYLRDMTEGSLWGEDLRGKLHEKGDSLRVKLRSAGTHMIAFDSKSAERGDSSLQYSVKVLLQAGNRKTDLSRASGIPLDIVPLRNPYEISKPRDIIFRVLYRGGPYAKAQVKVWHKTTGGNMQPALVNTNDKGEFAVRIDPDGEWMLSCVYTERKKEGSSEMQTYSGSLTFGYQR